MIGRWFALDHPVTKTELRRLLKRERDIRAGIEEQLNLARRDKDQLENLFKQQRARLKGG